MTELPDSTRWQLWIVAFGFFMQSLDTTIVNTALPSMAASLGESPLHMHMVIVSYVLTVAVMLPAIIFARVPNDTQTNAVISRRKRST